MQLSMLNGACWSRLKTLKTQTHSDSDPDLESVFYIGQYCEVCFVCYVHTVYLVEYCEINTFIPKRVLLAHCMV